MFWESPTEANTNQWKENLIMCFNKMISGDPSSPISKEAHLGVIGKTEDKAQMRHLLIKNGIMSEAGNLNIVKARTNLNKKAEAP